MAIMYKNRLLCIITNYVNEPWHIYMNNSNVLVRFLLKPKGSWQNLLQSYSETREGYNGLKINQKRAKNWSSWLKIVYPLFTDQYYLTPSLGPHPWFCTQLNIILEFQSTMKWYPNSCKYQSCCGYSAVLSIFSSIILMGITFIRVYTRAEDLK